MSARQIGSELRMLAVGLLLGRLVLRKPQAPEPVVVRIAEPASKPRRKRDFLTNNAVVASVVSAIVAGVISYLVANYQGQDAARQAQDALQTQQAQQIEAAATALYHSTNDVYNYQLKCAGANLGRRQCAAMSPDIDTFAGDTTSLGADIFNVTDRKAGQLATNFNLMATKVINDVSAADAKSDWYKMLDMYLDLQSRCGQLIKGQ
jgi:type II secretory pathway pseudopilin PulG